MFAEFHFFWGIPISCISYLPTFLFPNPGDVSPAPGNGHGPPGNAPKTGRNTHFGGLELHKPRPFCGPIPGELASMIHLLHIDRMCHKCLIDAGPTFRELGSPHPRFSSLLWLQRTERWPCILSFFRSLLWEFRVQLSNIPFTLTSRVRPGILNMGQSRIRPGIIPLLH